MTTLSSIRNAAIEDAGAGGLTVYATKEDLPSSGLTAGDQAYVSASSRLYVSNGSGWYNVALINATPSLSIDPTGAISLSTTGETTTITLTATDSDNAVAGLIYSVESDGSFAGLGTISQDSSVFTITPLSEDSATTTSAVLTFKASDGINFGSGDRTLTLSFKVENSNYTTLLLKNEETTDNQVDASTNTHTITENGNVTSTALSPYHPGGYSTYFDGTGDYLRNATVLTGQTATTFTIEAWVYMTANPSNSVAYLSPMFADGSNFSTSVYLFAGPDNDRVPVIRWYDSAEKYCKGSTALNLNQWYHIAFVVNSNAVKIYVDGVEETTSGNTTYTNWGSTNNGFEIGANNYGAFTGYIRDLRVTNTAVYTSTFTPPTASLTAISGTQLLVCHLPYIDDGSTNDYTLTVGGNTSTKRVGPYDYLPYTRADHGGSLYCDGTSDGFEIASATATQFGTGEWTIEGWFYPYDQAATQVLLYGYENAYATTPGTYELYIGTNGARTTPQINGNNGSWATSATSIGSTETFQYETWNHIVWSRSGNNLRIFVNGKSGANHAISASQTYDMKRSESQFFDKDGASGFRGYVSDLRVVKGTAVYTADFTPPTAPLTAITNTELLTCTNKNDIWDAGSGNLLTKAGDVTGGANSGTLKFGKTAVYLDGNGDYISAPTSDIFDLAGNVVWTIEGWFYWSSVSGEQTLVEKFTGGTGPGWTLYKLNTSNAIGFYSGSSATFSNAIGTVTSGQWYHVAITRDAAGTVRGFLDGTLNASGTYSIGNNSTGNLYIGARNGSANYMNGYVQDLRITKGLARYTANFTPPTAEFNG